MSSFLDLVQVRIHPLYEIELSVGSFFKLRFHPPYGITEEAEHAGLQADTCRPQNINLTAFIFGSTAYSSECFLKINITPLNRSGGA
jgi:hypothetical protein